MYSRRTPHRFPKSRSMKKKSPTSAWGHSTSSTRKTPARLGKVNKWPEVAGVAEAAEAAEAAAEVAEAAEAAAAEVAVAACRGESAASARRGHFPIARADAGLPMIGFDQIRPGQSCVVCSSARADALSRARSRASMPVKDGRERPNAAHDAERVVNPVEKR